MSLERVTGARNMTVGIMAIQIGIITNKIEVITEAEGVTKAEEEVITTRSLTIILLQMMKDSRGL